MAQKVRRIPKTKKGVVSLQLGHGPATLDTSCNPVFRRPEARSRGLYKILLFVNSPTESLFNNSIRGATRRQTP